MVAQIHSMLPRTVYVRDDSDAARLRRYQEARAFYDGTQWEHQRISNRTRLTLNYARRLMQSAVAYMFASPVTFDVPTTEGNEEAAELAELTLADYLGTIGADELDTQLALSAAVDGDAAVKVTWDPERGLPRVVAVDPAFLAVTIRPDDPKRAVAMQHQYSMTAAELTAALPQAADAIARAPGTRSAEGFSRASQRVIETWTDTTWKVEFAGSVVLDAVNPYGWNPYVVVANNPTATEFWGSSDLRDLYDVCREMNTRYSVVADVLNLSGYPIAVLENVDGSENIKVGPGQKWELPEDAKAYLLDLLEHGGVRLHVDYLAEIRRALHDLSETPRTSFGDSGRTISGAALEVEIQPLVQKVRRKRRGFDTFYRERNRRLLDLAERFGGVGLAGIRRAVAVWPSILPNDDDALATRLAQLTGSDNLAHRSAMAVWGIEDPENEWERLLEERTGIAATEPKPAFGGEGGDDNNNKNGTTPA